MGGKEREGKERAWAAGAEPGSAGDAQAGHARERSRRHSRKERCALLRELERGSESLEGFGLVAPGTGSTVPGQRWSSAGRIAVALQAYAGSTGRKQPTPPAP